MASSAVVTPGAAALGEPAQRSAVTFPKGDATAIMMASIADAERNLPSRDCAGCDEPIPAARLRLKPTARYCAPCQEKLGDVPTYHESHTGSVTGKMNFAAEDDNGPTSVFVTEGLGEVMERDADSESGTARNTGLHVRSKEGIDSWTAKRKERTQ